MNFKTETILDTYVKDENLHKLKASEITRIRKEQNACGLMGVLCALSLLTLAITGVAFGIWDNNFTLFLFIVTGIINVPILIFTYFLGKGIKKEVLKIAKRVNEEQ